MSFHLVDLSETDMFVPEGEELAERLQNGLEQHFEEATVEWVDCPDLTQEPFCLTSSGLCGDEILLEIGGMSQLFPRPQGMFNYYFSDILKEIYSSHTNALIIGAGIGMRRNMKQLNELFVNASFCRSRVSVESFFFNNRSRLAYLDEETGEYAINLITDENELSCYPHGNFFISEGKPGKVLKVQAKNCIGSYFLTAMQDALYGYSRDMTKFVGLGGTFVMKSGTALAHIIPSSWNDELKTAKDINNWLHYCHLEAPVIAVGTLINDSSYYEKSCENAGENAYGLTQSHFHVYSMFAMSFPGKGGHFHREIEPKSEVEYLGYFKPAKMFYHINSQPRFDGLQDFTNIMSY
ncbi:ester hydrolase C11orf54 homolog [Cataglyphis hispanica]|uniref:ester hydrolase C11orf54 homolog n=1 Tax=Cataglyphis hispanica TaxID=1086592 RepID=UPI0021801BA0|nr:ester hydrolase C11orf54 homolog [Cataglyphis hispanica]